MGWKYNIEHPAFTLCVFYHQVCFCAYFFLWFLHIFYGGKLPTDVRPVISKVELAIIFWIHIVAQQPC